MGTYEIIIETVAHACSWMYWTDVGTDRIERATMDGNSRTVLHRTGLNNAYGLTLDYQNQILYWLDYSLNKIENSSVDGSNRQLVTSARDPWAITYHEGTLYWTDLYSDLIFSFSVRTSSASVLRVTSYLGTDPRDIRVISEDRQPLGVFTNSPACTHQKPPAIPQYLVACCHHFNNN
jgi:peptidoglycan/xylan/chitin deacetylase (PgdA/CDA1 family)